MNHCPHDLPARAGAPFTLDQCRQCWLKANDNNTTTTVVVAALPSPCKYMGEELSGHKRDQAGLDHDRRWSLCTHPNQPLGPHVCPCKGCGVDCDGYQPDVEQR